MFLVRCSNQQEQSYKNLLTLATSSKYFTVMQGPVLSVHRKYAQSLISVILALVYRQMTMVTAGAVTGPNVRWRNIGSRVYRDQTSPTSKCPTFACTQWLYYVIAVFWRRRKRCFASTQRHKWSKRKHSRKHTRGKFLFRIVCIDYIIFYHVFVVMVTI